jgi:crotonyl-CoA carboxylase/reductase
MRRIDRREESMTHTATASTVRDAMHVGVVTCAPTAPVDEIAATLAHHQIHCLLVAELGGRGWGIVSDLDLMRAVAAGRHDLTAAQLASADVVTVSPEQKLPEAARLMAEHEVTHLVVRGAGVDEPEGVLSTLDIAHAIA